MGLAILTIQFNGYSISLDKKETGANIDFISHAHSDHVSAAKHSANVLASKETNELLDSAYDIKVNSINNHEFELIDSGHMLGSKQLYINDYENGKRIVYSGDFQMQESFAAKRIELKEADIAIVDSTYPYPNVMFNDNNITKELIQKWTSSMLDKGIVLFFAYRMGKTQELIRIFNEINIKPVVGRRISRINRVYMQNQIELEYSSFYENENEHAETLKHNFVGITDAQHIEDLAKSLSAIHNKKVYTAVATGFSKIFKFNTDAQFGLSSHADFYQTLRYVERVSPKNVLTYGPNKEILAKNLSDFGYKAQPFNNDAMKNILES